MNKGFWETLERPFFVLAPLADVTDAAFRRVIAKYGKPAVMFTEFVSADGLALAPEKGKEILKKDLIYTEEERPIVAQFFTSNPQHMESAAALAKDLGFDGVDINMGCPDRTIEKQRAGAALIKDPDLAVQLIEAAKRGAGDLPVSVKTRIGYNHDELDAWLPVLLMANPVAISIHARTRKEMSKVNAHWDRIAGAVKMRDEINPDVLIIGNGDVKDLDEAQKKVDETGCDGVMLGRAIFGNPWRFNTEKQDISTKEKLGAMVEHTNLFDELLGTTKNFAVMKKHYKAYVNGFDGAAELRNELMSCNNAREVQQTVTQYVNASVE